MTLRLAPLLLLALFCSCAFSLDHESGGRNPKDASSTKQSSAPRSSSLDSDDDFDEELELATAHPKAKYFGRPDEAGRVKKRPAFDGDPTRVSQSKEVEPDDDDDDDNAAAALDAAGVRAARGSGDDRDGGKFGRVRGGKEGLPVPIYQQKNPSSTPGRFRVTDEERAMRTPPQDIDAPRPPPARRVGSDATFEELIEEADKIILAGLPSNPHPILEAALAKAPRGNDTAQTLDFISSSLISLRNSPILEENRFLLVRLNAELMRLPGRYPFAHEFVARHFIDGGVMRGAAAEHFGIAARNTPGYLQSYRLTFEAALLYMEARRFAEASEFLTYVAIIDTRMKESGHFRQPCTLKATFLATQLQMYKEEEENAICALKAIASARTEDRDVKEDVVEDRKVLAQKLASMNKRDGSAKGSPKLSKYMGQMVRNDHSYDIDEFKVRCELVEALIRLGKVHDAFHHFGKLSAAYNPLSLEVVNATARLMLVDLDPVGTDYNQIRDLLRLAHQRAQAAAQRFNAEQEKYPSDLSFDYLSQPDFLADHPAELFRLTQTNPGSRTNPGAFSRIRPLASPNASEDDFAYPTSSTRKTPILASPVQVFDNTLPLNLLLGLTHLLREKSPFWSAIQPIDPEALPSFWYASPLTNPPRNQIEQAIHYITNCLVDNAGGSADDDEVSLISQSLAERVVGVEWSVDRLPFVGSESHNTSTRPLQYYYDREWLSSEGQVIHPLFVGQLVVFGRGTTVGATLVVNQTWDEALLSDSTDLKSANGWVVPSLPNRLTVMEGSFMKGILPALRGNAAIPLLYEQSGARRSAEKKKSKMEQEMEEMLAALESGGDLAGLSAEEREAMRAKLRSDFKDAFQENKDSENAWPNEVEPLTVINFAFLGFECAHGELWKGQCAELGPDAELPFLREEQLQLQREADLEDQQIANQTLVLLSLLETQMKNKDNEFSGTDDGADEAGGDNRLAEMLSGLRIAENLPSTGFKYSKADDLFEIPMRTPPPSFPKASLSLSQKMAFVGARIELLESELKTVSLTAPPPKPKTHETSKAPVRPLPIQPVAAHLSTDLCPLVGAEELEPYPVSNVWKKQSSKVSRRQLFVEHLIMTAKRQLLQERYQDSLGTALFASAVDKSSDPELFAILSFAKGLKQLGGNVTTPRDQQALALLEMASLAFPGMLLQAHFTLSQFYYYSYMERIMKRDRGDADAVMDDLQRSEDQLKFALLVIPGFLQFPKLVDTYIPDERMLNALVYHLRILTDHFPYNALLTKQYADVLYHRQQYSDAARMYVKLSEFSAFGVAYIDACLSAAEIFMFKLNQPDRGRSLIACARSFAESTGEPSLYVRLEKLVAFANRNKKT